MELSFTRIGLLIKKQFIENKKLYLFGTLAMIGIMSFVFFMSVTDYSGFRKGNQGAFLGIGLLSFGCLFTLTLFSNLDTTEGRTNIFMLPTTTLEKLICAIVYGSILFPILYLITVYPMLRLANYVDNNYMGHLNEAYIFDVDKMQVIFLALFYLLQSMVLLLSVYFRQYKVVKSVVTLCLLFFGGIYFYPKILNQFLPRSFNDTRTITIHKRSYDDDLVLINTKTIKEKQFLTGRESGTPFSNVLYFAENTSLYLELPSYQKVWFFVLLCMSVPFMWLIIWFRLKESEIN